MVAVAEVVVSMASGASADELDGVLVDAGAQHAVVCLVGGWAVFGSGDARDVFERRAARPRTNCLSDGGTRVGACNGGSWFWIAIAHQSSDSRPRWLGQSMAWHGG
jgi:hypothetical protein